MIQVPILVRRSSIHGNGLFTPYFLPRGSVLWRFGAPDTRIRLDDATDEQKHFGYVNPENPDFLVICGDLSCFWNFGLNGAENCGPSEVLSDEGESAIIAIRDIGAGEELLISVDSDADACRKLQGTWLASDKASPRRAT